MNWQDILYKPLVWNFTDIGIKGGQVLESPFGYAYVYRNEDAIVGLTLSRERGTLKDHSPLSTFGDIPEIDCLSLLLQPSIPLAVKGTPFQQQIWQTMTSIPVGALWSYKELAQTAGFPIHHSRAVGGAVGANPICVLIPCHRVIGSDGGIGGYRWGVDVKKRLIEFEKNKKG